MARATLVGRRNRFTLLATDDAGEQLILHLPNSGRLQTVLVAGSSVLYAPTSPSPHRLTAGRALCIDVPNVGRITVDATLLARAAAADLRAPTGESVLREAGFAGYDGLREEVRTPAGRRLDIGLTGADGEITWLIEVKSVTMVRDRVALFPDAPTVRGSSHVHLLGDVAAAGRRAAVILAVGRPDADAVSTNGEVDPDFAAALTEAAGQGLRVVGWRVDASAQGLSAGPLLPLRESLAGARIGG